MGSLGTGSDLPLFPAIHYFRIAHNALCLPRKILHKHCFQFLLGRAGGGGGASKVHYGQFENSEVWQARALGTRQNLISFPDLPDLTVLQTKSFLNLLLLRFFTR